MNKNLVFLAVLFSSATVLAVEAPKATTPPAVIVPAITGFFNRVAESKFVQRAATAAAREEDVVDSRLLDKASELPTVISSETADKIHASLAAEVNAGREVIEGALASLEATRLNNKKLDQQQQAATDKPGFISQVGTEIRENWKLATVTVVVSSVVAVTAYKLFFESACDRNANDEING